MLWVLVLSGLIQQLYCTRQKQNTASDLSWTKSHNCETGLSNFRNSTLSHGFWKKKNKPSAIYDNRTNSCKLSSWFLREINVLWWMDGRWCYYSKYWTDARQENEFRCTFVYVCSAVVHICTLYETLPPKRFQWQWLVAVTHLFLTNRMATSTSSMKTRTPALIPAIFTTRSVCLAGSGMTSGSSVAPTA